jgi:hypothetical protein
MDSQNEIKHLTFKAFLSIEHPGRWARIAMLSGGLLFLASFKLFLFLGTDMQREAPPWTIYAAFAGVVIGASVAVVGMMGTAHAELTKKR